MSWFRDKFCRVGLEQASVSRVASHSLRGTWLSVAAELGLQLSLGQCVGYNVVRGGASALNYGRDTLAAPLRELEAAHAQVKSGTVVPDDMRSRRRLFTPLDIERSLDSILSPAWYWVPMLRVPT